MVIIYLPTKHYSTKQEEFEVKKDLYVEYCDAYPEVDVLSELGKMRAWLLSNDQKRKTMRGMKRFINSWLSRAQGNANSRNDLSQPMHPWIWKNSR